MKLSSLFLPLVIIVTLVAGCSNVKDANEKNFKKAVISFLNEEYPFCYFAVNFPYESDSFSVNKLPAVLHTIAPLGIVKETEISRKNIPASFMSKERVDIVYSYELTSEGSKYYKTDATTSLAGNDLGGFCFGKAELVEIINFTEPSDFMGVKVVQVTYTYKITNIPEWARNTELLNLDSRLKKDAQSENEPIKRTDAFILTDKGWLHERLFKK